MTVGEGESAGHTGTYIDVDLGDDITLTVSIGAVSDHHDGTWSWALGTNDGPYSQMVTITAQDGAGESDTDTFELVVHNVAPSFEASPGETLSPASAGVFTRSLSFVDPGADLWSCTVDYGDGSVPLTIVPAARTFDLDHTYPEMGDYVVSVTVEDGDGGSTTEAFILHVLLDRDDDGVLDDVDVCPTTAGLADRQGCPVGSANTVTLHIVDQQKPKSACPDGKGRISRPSPGPRCGSLTETCWTGW